MITSLGPEKPLLARGYNVDSQFMIDRIEMGLIYIFKQDISCPFAYLPTCPIAYFKATVLRSYEFRNQRKAVWDGMRESV